jgi:hypothetical protein
MIHELLDIEAVAANHTGLSRTVLDYVSEMKRTIDRAKEPGFDEASWKQLGSYVAVDAFTRVGPFKDAMDWPQYVAFLTGWAPRRHWECSVRRVTEAGSLVMLELEERSAPDDPAAAANSVSAYEFDDAGKIRQLDVYLQMAPSG